MTSCTRATLCPPRCSTPARKRQHPSAMPTGLLAALALAALLGYSPSALAQPTLTEFAQAQPTLTQSTSGNESDRGMSPGPARYVLVKAEGQGVDPAEAEQDALRTARLIAAKHYAALGGANALEPSPHGLRIIASHSTPPMGLATVHAMVLVELRLRALPEPPPAALALPVLRVSVDATPQVTVEANRACEVMIAVDAGPDAEPAILPGGGGAAYRLAPGRPMQQPLPQTLMSTSPPASPQASIPASLRVLACTGGLYAPAIAPTLDEALAKARTGKFRPAISRGVISECVEIKTALPGRADMPKRSMRQKGSQSPVNMTGAAGREAGLPVPSDLNKSLP